MTKYRLHWPQFILILTTLIVIGVGVCSMAYEQKRANMGIFYNPSPTYQG